MLARARVLVIDDSAVVRGLLAKGLAAHGLEVVATASDPFIARELILKHRPDVLTLDVEMPRMSGLTFLERLMAFQPLPVVVLSSLTPAGSSMALRALELGAIEVLAKPAHDWAAGPESAAMARVASVVKLAAGAKVGRRWTAGLKIKMQARRAPGAIAGRVLALGASTGGTQALAAVMAELPSQGAGCVIVQHMPADFMEGFAAHLDQVSDWSVRVARHGDLLREGEALLAPGDRHMVLQKAGDGWRVQLKDSPPVNFVRPSVDVLMLSVAHEAGSDSAGALLTGMGRDGAEGLLAMRRAGARTLAQDEASSVIWGMPGEAHRVGAVEALVPLHLMSHRLRGLLAPSAAA
jgi:two-component system chemotaxis response regulator CheB